MIVKTQFSRLAQIRWWEYLARFLFGGLVTMVTGIIAKEFGPVIGGLFLAFPGIFPASITLVERHEREKKRRQGLSGTRRGRVVAAVVAAGAALGSLGLVGFALVGWALFPRLAAWQALALATAAWLALSVAAWIARLRT